LRCEDVRPRIEEYLLGLPDRAERREIEAHLASCPDCERQVREARAFEKLLDLAHDPDRDEILVDALAVRRARRRRGGLLALSLGAAAALLVLGLVLRPGPDELEPGVDTVLAAGETRRLPHARVVARVPAGVRAEEDGRRLHVRSGAVRVRVEPGHGRFVVVTPAGEIEVVGTEFEVSVMRKEAWIAGGVVVAALVATGVVLFHDPSGVERLDAGEVVVASPNGTRKLGPQDVARLLHEHAEMKQRIEEQEEELANLRAEVARAGAGGPGEGAGTGPSRPSGETPAEGASEDLPKSIRETDWNRLGAIVAKLTDPEDAPKPSDPVYMLQMAYLVGRLEAMGAELGVPDSNDVFYHPQVFRRFVDGVVRALYPDQSEEEREDVVTMLADVVAAERARWPSPMLRIEKQARDLELALKMIDRVRGTLDEAQAERLLLVMGADRPGGYSMSWMAMPEIASLRTTMGQSLASMKDLTPAEQQIAMDLGAAFVDRYLAAQESLRKELGDQIVDAALGRDEARREAEAAGKLSRLAQVRIKATFARVQADTMRALFERVSPTVREQMLAAPLHLWVVSLARSD
jgi:ferric-dicitrate binding protein FerR (iron transport regulator)